MEKFLLITCAAQSAETSLLVLIIGVNQARHSLHRTKHYECVFDIILVIRLVDYFEILLRLIYDLLLLDFNFLFQFVAIFFVNSMFALHKRYIFYHFLNFEKNLIAGELFLSEMYTNNLTRVKLFSFVLFNSNNFADMHG